MQKHFRHNYKYKKEASAQNGNPLILYLAEIKITL